MAKVFISYRRVDSTSISGRIYDRLVLRFGRKNVFKDVDNIPAGVRFGNYIQDSLRQCLAALVIIGPGWLDARTPEGQRRLADPGDWVRLEIETAFALGLRVIPVLVDGATMPTAASLPASLQDLTQINAIQVRNDPDFSRDMERLVAAIEQAFSSRSSPLFGRRGPASPQPQSPSEAPPAPGAPAPGARAPSQPAAGRATAAWPAPARHPTPTTARTPTQTRRLLTTGAVVLLIIALVVGTAATLRGLFNGRQKTNGPPAAADAQQVFTINETGPIRGDLETLDPQAVYYPAEYRIAKAIFVGLVTLDSNLNVIPDGASSWAVSPDGLTYTFTIRSGLKWSDGTPILAQDFADAIARSQDPCVFNGHQSIVNFTLGGTVNELLAGARAEESMTCPKNTDGTYPTALPGGSPIEGSDKAVDPVDDTTLKLRLSHPAPYFLAALSYPTADPVPEKMVKDGGFTWSQRNLCASTGMASGPFKCVLWDHAGHLKLQRNDSYYGGKAKMREIDLNLYSDAENAYEDFRAGKANLAYPPADQLHDATLEPGFKRVPYVEVGYLAPNWQLPPFDNLDARIAFDAAIDRTQIASVAFSGTVAPDVNYIVNGLPGYNAGLKTSWGDPAATALKGNVKAAQQYMQKYVNEACGSEISRCPRWPSSTRRMSLPRPLQESSRRWRRSSSSICG